MALKLLKGRIIVLLSGIITALLDPESAVQSLSSLAFKVKLILSLVWFYFLLAGSDFGNECERESLVEVLSRRRAV